MRREQEHSEEKGKLVRVDGEEFKERADELLNREREMHQLRNEKLISSAKDWQQKHMNLEKEFRIALFLVGICYPETLVFLFVPMCV